MEQVIKELKGHLETLNSQERLEVMRCVQQEVSKMISEEINRRIKKMQSTGETDINKINDDVHLELAKGPEKFIGLTEKVKDEITMQCVKKIREEKPELANNIHILECLIDYLGLEEPQLFLELDQLSEMFKFISLKVSSQIEIFSYIMKINHQLDFGNGDSTFLPDVEAILNYNYKYIKPSELKNIFDEQRFFEFLSSKSFIDRKARKEVEKRYEETKIDLTSRQQACNILGEIFEKEVQDITDEDYQIIIDKMNEVFFGHIAYRVVKKIKKQKETELIQLTLKEEMVERNPKDNISLEEKKLPKSEIEMPKKQTSLNQILREINKYYEIETKKIKELLSIDQIIYVLSLMYSIEMEKSIIEEFLRNATRELKKLHPFAIYNQGYDKFKYLSHENSEIKYHLDMIEYILSDMNFFICSKEEYEEIKRLITEEIDALIRITNGDYTYEIESAKKLCKENQG